MRRITRILIAILATSFSASAMAVPIVVADLGALDGNTSASGTLSENGLHWYSFSVDGFTYLDIATTAASIDTEIGLYDAAGNLVGNDDDNGVGLLSALSFGTGSGLLLGDSFNLGGDGIANGENGALAAGLYYLVVGEFNVTFNATGFDVVSSGTDTGGTYDLSIFTDAASVAVSEPGTLALLGLGLFGMAARRRKA